MLAVELAQRPEIDVHGDVFRVLLRRDYRQPPVCDLGFEKEIESNNDYNPELSRVNRPLQSGDAHNEQKQNSLKTKLQTNTSVQRRVVRPVLLSTALNRRNLRRHKHTRGGSRSKTNAKWAEALETIK